MPVLAKIIMMSPRKENKHMYAFGTSGGDGPTVDITQQVAQESQLIYTISLEGS